MGPTQEHSIENNEAIVMSTNIVQIRNLVGNLQHGTVLIHAIQCKLSRCGSEERRPGGLFLILDFILE
jgi:hypothetical protein